MTPTDQPKIAYIYSWFYSFLRVAAFRERGAISLRSRVGFVLRCLNVHIMLYLVPAYPIYTASYWQRGMTTALAQSEVLAGVHEVLINKAHSLNYM